jgi:hypothetical protein
MKMTGLGIDRLRLKLRVMSDEDLWWLFLHHRPEHVDNSAAVNLWITIMAAPQRGQCQTEEPSAKGLQVPASTSPDHRHWIRPRYPFFLPVKILSRVFRGKFLAGLKCFHRRNQLCCAGPAAALADPQQFAKLLRRLHRHESVEVLDCLIVSR